MIIGMLALKRVSLYKGSVAIITASAAIAVIGDIFLSGVLIIGSF
jgi:hypothetical protein